MSARDNRFLPRVFHALITCKTAINIGEGVYVADYTQTQPDLTIVRKPDTVDANNFANLLMEGGSAGWYSAITFRANEVQSGETRKRYWAVGFNRNVGSASEYSFNFQLFNGISSWTNMFTIHPNGDATLNGALTAGGGIQTTAQVLTADATEETANTILSSTRNVDVDAVRNDANDFIILPALSGVPVGHEIIIVGNVASNFEMRTPATSGEKINNVDSDGTQEYLVTSGDTVRVIATDNGWIATSYTNLGAVRTAVVPD